MQCRLWGCTRTWFSDFFASKAGSYIVTKCQLSWLVHHVHWVYIPVVLGNKISSDTGWYIDVWMSQIPRGAGWYIGVWWGMAGRYIGVCATHGRAGGTLMQGQCTASNVGWYIFIRITKLPVELDGTSMQGQCMGNIAGSYIDIEITKSLMELAHTLMYG